MASALNMDSWELLRRGQKTISFEKNFLSAHNEGDEDDGENCNAEDDKKSITSEHEDPEDGQTTGERGENTRNGLWKRLSSFMCPCFSKLNWRLFFNLEASTSGDDRKQSKRPSNNNVENAANIKQLQDENKRLIKLAVKFLDEYEQLKRRIGEMSEVKDQLMAALRNCDELNSELQALQRSRDSLYAQLSKQSDEHRDDRKRLDAELRNAREAVTKLASDKQSIEAKNAKNAQSLQTAENALQNLTKMRDELKADLREQNRLHNDESRQLKAKLDSAEYVKREDQRTINTLQRDMATVEHRARMAQEKNDRVKQKIEPVKRKIELLRHHLPLGGIVLIGDLQYLEDRIADAANEAR